VEEKDEEQNEKDDRQEVVRDLRHDRAVTNDDVTRRDRDRARDMRVTRSARVIAIVEAVLAHEVPVELVITSRPGEMTSQRVNELIDEIAAEIDQSVIEVLIRRTNNDSSQRQKPLSRKLKKKPSQQVIKRRKNLLEILTIRSKVSRMLRPLRRLQKVPNCRLFRLQLPQQL